METIDPFAAFDHFNPPKEVDGTPFPYYQQIRDHALEKEIELGWSNQYGGFWAVVGYQANRDIFLNPTAFSNAEMMVPSNTWRIDRPFMLVAQDDPEHKRYRELVQAPFSPRMTGLLSERLSDMAAKLIDGFIEQGRIDIAKSLADEVPTRMTAIMLGVPLDDGKRYRRWTDALSHQGVPDDSEAMAEIHEMNKFFDELLEDRKRDPGDDLISLLLSAEIDGQHLTDSDIQDFFVIFVLGGIVNTSRLLSDIFWRLGWDKELRMRLILNPELVSPSIEEFLRFYSPGIVCRLIHEEIDFYGAAMRPGQMIVQVLPIANRDPRHFDYPDTFIPDRLSNRHMGLGMGIHRCLGAHLLRVEVEATLRSFFHSIPEYELDTQQRPHWVSGLVSGFDSVPIVFPPSNGKLL
jgi:cytochrome P450